MSLDSINHMQKAWNLEQNPFPAEAIHVEDSPYCPTVFDQETQEFRRKFIRGSVRGSMNVGFLWSQGAQADTGFGKTTLLREITKEINRDFGVDTLSKAGVHTDKQSLIVAAYSNLNNLNASGLYSVMFNAVLNLAGSKPDSEAVFDKARQLIAAQLGTSDADRIAEHVKNKWLDICGTAPPLR